MRTMPRLSLLATLAATLLLVALLRPQGSNKGIRMPQPITSEPAHLQIHLADGVPPKDEPPRAVMAEPITPEQVRVLLTRVPPLPTDAALAEDVRLPAPAVGRPRAGKDHVAPFPPEVSIPAPPAADSGPLEVLRHSPEGDVPQLPRLSLTFSQAMVPLTDHASLAARDVPVKLAPQPPGEWYWVGTRTLEFRPSGRPPMATPYVVTVPAGARSATGGALAEALRYEITTPPPKLLRSWTGDASATLEPLMFLGFDQRVVATDALAAMKLALGAMRLPLRLATPAEIETDVEVKRMSQDAVPGTWLALRAVDALPLDSEISLAIGPGLPSAEGPLRTTVAETLSFHTRAPLSVTGNNCTPNDACPPSSPLWIWFNNALDEKAFDADDLQLVPALPRAVISAQGSGIQIEADTSVDTEYRVTLPASLRDVYGQTLGKRTVVSFHVGAGSPELFATKDHLVVQDAASPGEPVFSVFSRNFETLRTRVKVVTPADWVAWNAWHSRAGYPNQKAEEPPGREVANTLVRIAGNRGDLVETRIPLGSALTQGLGHALVIVEPTTPPKPNEWRPAVRAWVQVTRLGLDAISDDDELVAWVSALSTGAPIAGADVALGLEGQGVATGVDGLARLTLPEYSPTKQRDLVVVRAGDDVAFLPVHSLRRQVLSDAIAFHVFDDRGLYRPGESARVKGWLRTSSRGPQGDVTGVPKGLSKVAWNLRDPMGNEGTHGETRVTQAGGFDLELSFPEGAALGHWYLSLRALDANQVELASGSHALQVQEFRRPEYEVKVEADPGPHVVGGRVDVVATASYFAGGGLAQAPVRWSVTTSSTSFHPPGWDGFAFGVFRPWWIARTFSEGRGGFWPGATDTHVETHEGRTDADGKHVLAIELLGVDPPEPTSLVAEATVEDVNRQAWSDRVTLLVQPSTLHVGLKLDASFVEQGESVGASMIVTDVEGHAVTGRKTALTFARVSGKLENGAWIEELVDAQDCSVTSASEPVNCSFQPREAGQWRFEAIVTDDAGRKNRTTLTMWVAGASLAPRRDLDEDQAELIPDRKEYRDGDVARVLVRSPFAPAEGLLLLGREGLVDTRRFSMKDETIVLEIPIRDAMVPGVEVQVQLVGSKPSTPERASKRVPAFAASSISLAVPPLSRSLTLSVEPRERETLPGSATSIDVQVRNAGGQPVADAEIALIVVDEAVLALTGYELLDPLATFYVQRDAGLMTQRSRPFVVVPTDIRPRGGEAVGRLGYENYDGAMMKSGRMTMAAPMAMAMESAGGGAPPAPIALRTDFRALALWAPAVITDASGHARAEVQLPDSLTRYRVMAVAVAGARQFGKGESSLTARRPLMVRPSPPRFLNFGDRFELPIVVQNLLDVPVDVLVAARASNLDVVGHAGRRVQVKAKDRLEVRVAFAAAQPGTARIQVVVVSADDRWSDAAQVDLPVYTPATTEGFATYGVLAASPTDSTVQPFLPPRDVLPQFGGLELTTSSTALSELSDAMLQLQNYPFDCSEQIASRVLAIACLKDALAALSAPALPSPEALRAQVAADVKRLAALQHGDGGFSFWRSDDHDVPQVTLHVAWALQEAKDAGFEVPTELLERSRGYLREIESHLDPKLWTGQARRSVIAQALSVRKRMGDADPKRAAALVDDAAREGLSKRSEAQLSIEALGWLLPTLSAAPQFTTQAGLVRLELMNRVDETAGAAHFALDYGANAWLVLASEHRADAVILDAMLSDAPKSDLIPKLVRGLLNARVRGTWSTTQESSHVIAALGHYFRLFESETPDFFGRAWVGELFVADHAFQGRTPDHQVTSLPMASLLEAGPADIALRKDGRGRLYWRLGLRYAPTDLTLAPLSRGFEVSREYEAVDEPSDVRREEDGTWVVRAGARVRTTVRMVALGRRAHVALVDPLPAGFEPLNPALATTEAVPRDGDEAQDPQPMMWRWPWWSWHDHENLRDQRAEAFAMDLQAGSYEYRYVSRATTPGSFIVPPPKAEEMYAPETFGRGASAIVTVR